MPLTDEQKLEQRRERDRRYYEKNKERLALKYQAYYDANRERIIERMKVYHAKKSSPSSS